MGHSVSVERRTSDGSGFVPIFQGETIFPDEPVRLAVRNAPWGSVRFRVTLGTREGVRDIGVWDRNVGALSGGYAFVDIDPLRTPGIYVVGAESSLLFMGSPHIAILPFKVAAKAQEPGAIVTPLPPGIAITPVGPAAPPASAPPAQRGIAGLLGDVKGVAWVVAAIVGLYAVAQVAKRR